VADLGGEERAYTLTNEDIFRINPNTANLIFSSSRDAALNKFIYERIPILLREEPLHNPWKISFLAMFHMTNDADCFRTRGQLIQDGYCLTANVFSRNDETYVPLYEAKLAGIFNHRAATFEGMEESGLYGTRVQTTKATEVHYLTQPGLAFRDTGSTHEMLQAGRRSVGHSAGSLVSETQSAQLLTHEP
jgi:hypothetical protein